MKGRARTPALLHSYQMLLALGDKEIAGQTLTPSKEGRMTAAAARALFITVFAVWVETLRKVSNCCDGHSKIAFLDVLSMVEDSSALIIGFSQKRICEEHFVLAMMTLIDEMKAVTGPIELVTVVQKKGEAKPFTQSQGRA
jgi:hypothetical protein